MKKYLPILLIVIAALLAWYMGIHKYLTFDQLKGNHIYLKEYVANHKLVSVGIYMGIYISVVSLSIPAATFLTLIGGYFFGHLVGTIMVVFSASIGATAIFMSTKLAAKPAPMDRYKSKLFERMRKGFEEDAFLYMLTLRLIPIFPFVLINIGAGILQIKLRTFFLGTLIGIIPGSFVYTSIGTALQSVLDSDTFEVSVLVNKDVFIALTGLGILALVPIFYRRYKRKLS